MKKTILVLTVLISLCFASNALAQGCGDPEIGINSYPPIGTKDSGKNKIADSVIGYVTGNYANIAVACYIRVLNPQDGKYCWWVKPTWEEPKTSVDSSGNWLCDIASDISDPRGNDENADLVRVYAINDSDEPWPASQLNHQGGGWYCATTEHLENWMSNTSNPYHGNIEYYDMVEVDRTAPTCGQ